MKQRWRRLAALGLTLCLALSILVMPAQAVQLETEDPADQVQAEETLAPAEEETQLVDEPETTEAEDENLALLPEEEEEETVIPAQTRQVPALLTAHVRYMEGFPEGTFQPDKQLTRAQAAQMVYRLLAAPDSGMGSCSYADVPASQWYAKAVTALCRLGLFDDGSQFRPEDIITRAEFVDLLVRLQPEAQGQAVFSDVPAWHWAARQIGAAVQLGWINGYPDGTFKPDKGLSRAEACTIINRMTGRTGDTAQATKIIGLGLYSDVTIDYWAALTIAEASVSHTPQVSGAVETWYGVDLSALTFTAGFHDVGNQLFYVDRYGKLAISKMVGVYSADASGALTSWSYRMPNVPYISQIDNIYAWVGCEAVSTLMGLQAKGYALNTPLKTFLDNLPRSASDPEKGFVGSPYVPDKSKKTRTTIYPAKLAEYANSYCGGDIVCQDFRGASVTDLQRELLAGNCVVAYMTLWWKEPFYRNYVIEGQVQSLVSNNHAVLVCGYDPDKGYFISDPYNYYNRGQVHQYWENAKTFESIWNERFRRVLFRSLERAESGHGFAVNTYPVEHKPGLPDGKSWFFAGGAPYQFL